VPDGSRRDLIDRDSILDVGAIGLSRVSAGQERSSAAGMISTSVTVIASAIQSQSGEDRKMLPKLF
jgi:hypothetical protein